MRPFLVGPTVAAIAVLLLAGCSDSGEDPESAPSGSAEDTPSASPRPDTEVSSQAATGQPEPLPEVPPEVAEEASDSAGEYADVVADVLSDPGSEVAPGAIDGVALEALQAQADEYERSGWRIEGEPRVLSVDVYERADDRMVIGACVDNSRVKVVDQSGDVVSDGAGTPPTLNIFTLSLRDSDWVIVESSFPSDPDC